MAGVFGPAVPDSVARDLLTAMRQPWPVG